MNISGVKEAATALISISKEHPVEFMQPLWLLALIPLVLVAAWLYFKDPTRRGELLVSRGSDMKKLPKGAGIYWLYFTNAMRVVVPAFVILTLADPRVLSEPDAATTEGIDLVVSLDVSGSMRAADFLPKDRLNVAKQVISDEVLTRKRDRTGLVVFAGEAFTQAPLTHDKELLRDVLEGVRTGVIEDGTAIGDGIAVALNRLRDSKAKTKAILLLTDGDNNAGRIAPESAIDLAVDMGVKIFPILVGRGGRVPFPDGEDIFGAPRYVNVEIPTNPELMKRIAVRTGGTYYLATDAQSLKTSFQQVLDSLDRSLLDGAPPVRRKIALAPIVMLVAIGLFLTALIASLTRASGVP